MVGCVSYCRFDLSLLMMHSEIKMVGYNQVR